MGFIESDSGPLGDFDGYFQQLPRIYNGDEPINVTPLDKVHLNCDSNNGSILNGVWQPILYSLAFDKPPRHET